MLGNKTYVGEEELEKLQYTEQVGLEELAIVMCIIESVDSISRDGPDMPYM